MAPLIGVIAGAEILSPSLHGVAQEAELAARRKERAVRGASWTRRSTRDRMSLSTTSNSPGRLDGHLALDLSRFFGDDRRRAVAEEVAVEEAVGGLEGCRRFSFFEKPWPSPAGRGSGPAPCGRGAPRRCGRTGPSSRARRSRPARRAAGAAMLVDEVERRAIVLVLGVLGVLRVAELLVDVRRERRPVGREALDEALQVRDAEVVDVGGELVRREGRGGERHVAAVAAAEHDDARRIDVGVLRPATSCRPRCP